jgi:hypothetical protein
MMNKIILRSVVIDVTRQDQTKEELFKSIDNLLDEHRFRLLVNIGVLTDEEAQELVTPQINKLGAFGRTYFRRKLLMIIGLPPKGATSSRIGKMER